MRWSYTLSTSRRLRQTPQTHRQPSRLAERVADLVRPHSVIHPTTKENKKPMNHIHITTNKIIALALLLLCSLSSVTFGSDASNIQGIWTAPSGSSIEITPDKWIGHAGPMQINLKYTIQSAEGGNVVVALDDDSGKKPAFATLRVSGDVLTITGNSMWKGTWTRKN